MKKGIVIGIVAGVFVTSITVCSMIGAYLNKAKAASSDVIPHNAKVEIVNQEVDAVLGNSSGKNFAATNYNYGYASDEAYEAAPETYEQGGGTSAAPQTSNDVNVDPSKGRLLIRTVSVSAETKDIMNVKNDVEAHVKAVGGYIENSSMSGTGNNRDLRRVNYTIRVPADKLDELIAKVGNSCTVISSSENSSDVTLEYVDTKARVESLRVEYEQLMKLLGQAEDLDRIILLQSRLTEVRYQIESYESRIRVLENQVQYATLNLMLTEVLEETQVEEAHVVTYGEKVSDQFKDMWEGTVVFFQNFVLGLIAAIPFLVFLGIVGVIVIVIVFSVRKKRRKAAALRAKAEEAKPVSKDEKKDEKKEESE